MAPQGSTLDMSLYFGTAEQKKHFCNELLRLLKQRGCVKITNHSIPDADVHQLFDMVCFVVQRSKAPSLHGHRPRNSSSSLWKTR